MGYNFNDTTSKKHEVVQNAPFHPELHDFRHQIETDHESLRYQPYTFEKKKLRGYKLVFFLLGIIFASLSLFIFLKNPNWTYSYLFFGGVGFKSLINFICIILAGFSFFLAFHRKIEVELVYRFYRHAKDRIRQKRFHRQAQISTQQDGEAAHNARIELKHLSHDVLEKMSHKKEDVLVLLEEITKRSSQDRSAKELLFNQVLTEFRLSMRNLVVNFKP